MGSEYIYGIPTPLPPLLPIFQIYNGLIFNDLAFSLCAKVKIKCLYINYLGLFRSYLPKRQKALILLIFCRCFLRLYIVSLPFVRACIQACVYVRMRLCVYACACMRACYVRVRYVRAIYPIILPHSKSLFYKPLIFKHLQKTFKFRCIFFANYLVVSNICPTFAVSS